jgi:CorA-like Mg2+ transporter protein
MIIPTTWNLPEPIRARLGQTTYGRQRAILEEGHLLLVLHKPPGPDDAGRDGVLFWRNPAGEWQFSRGGPGISGLKRHVQSYSEIEAKLSETYEQATEVTTLFDVMEPLTPLLRAARNMRQALQAAREGVRSDRSLIEIRDLGDEVERNLELLAEDVRNAIQHRMARDSEAQARASHEALQASHRLNVLAAVFLPLTAITSLFGMSFSRGMDEFIPGLFWVVLVIGGTLGLLMKRWVTASVNPSGGKTTTGKN